MKQKKAYFTKKSLREEIIREGKVLRMHSGAVEVFADKVTDSVAKWVEKRGAVTQADLNRKVAAELKKFNPDLAYVYENRGKII